MLLFIKVVLPFILIINLNSGASEINTLTNDTTLPELDKSNSSKNNDDKPHASVINDENESDMSFPNNERILKLLVESLEVIRTPQCLMDLNATIDGIKHRKPWAIASKLKLNMTLKW